MYLKKTFMHFLLVLCAILTIAPFVWMLSASFMYDGHASVYPPRFIPDQFTIIQYEHLLARLNLARNFFNSLFLSLSVSLISLLLNSMAAFAFAKYRFKWKDKIFNTLLASMIIPAQITMLPLFLMLRYMGLVNTYFAIIIPGMANIFGIFFDQAICTKYS